MARLDDLLSQIRDEKLRTQIAKAVSDLRRKKKFGLVYEEHIPETVLLASETGLKVGAEVVLRRQPTNTSRYKVQKVNKTTATIVLGAEPRKERIADLLVVTPFGQPVYSVLRPSGENVVRSPDKAFHVVINGENFHALQLLLFAHEGSIDCIYIDPPYNTGDRSWKYNNDYVDANDAWHHSKWLSMMERRLRLAKKLLKPDGVLIVTIDEHEVTHLGLLLEQLFPSSRRQMVTIVNNAAGVSQGGFYRVEEYAYFCFAGEARPSAVADDLLSNETKSQKEALWFSMIRYGGINALPAKRPGLVYPIIVDVSRRRIVGTGRTLKQRGDAKEVIGDLNQWRPTESDSEGGTNLSVIWPYRGDGSMSTWQTNPEGLIQLADAGFVRIRPQIDGPGGNACSISYLKKGHRSKVMNGSIPNFGREPDNGPYVLGEATRAVIPKTVWKRARHDAGKWGSRTLRELLGTVSFDYAKSPYAVLDTLRTILANKPNAVVLDFFAGSGTTLHSLAMLNAEDNGARRCILVTNNQVDEAKTKLLNEDGYFVGDEDFEMHGISRAVTTPRVRAALTGNRNGTSIDGEYIGGRKIGTGFDENAAFFDLVYEDADGIEVGERFESILPALWLASGAQSNPAKLEQAPKWFMNQDSSFAVLLDEDRFRDFEKALALRRDITHIWLVTDSEPAFARMRQRLPAGIRVGMLYRDYLRNFQVNVEGSK